MQYQYVCKGSVEKTYDENGVSVQELPLGIESSESEPVGVHFYRYDLQPGAVVHPQLDKENTVVLIFNGRRAFISCETKTYHVTEPSVFIPDFDKNVYMVGAVQEEVEFLLCVVERNDYDRETYRQFHLKLPCFKKCSEAIEYDQADCKLFGTHSYTFLQNSRLLGHLMMGMVTGVGTGTEETGHAILHQWNYALPGTEFILDVDGVSDVQREGDFSYVKPGKPHRLVSDPGKKLSYIWLETYVMEDLTEWNAMIAQNLPLKDMWKAVQNIMEK